MNDLDQLLQCGYCPKKFQTEAALIPHVEKCHSNEERDLPTALEDKEDEITFVSTANSSRDSIIDTFECFPCELKFSNEEALVQHINEAHECESEEEEKFHCKICGKKFDTKQRLVIHAQVHDSSIKRDRPFKCSSCSKTFYTSQDLWSHQRIHLGTKFTCDQCGKQLASTGSLHNHIKSVHTVEKAFKCTICDKRFALKQKLRNHVITSHQGQKPFQCHECDEGFVHKQSYDAHLRKHQGVHLKCKICSKPFTDAGYLKKHMRWHSKVQKSKE